MKQTLALALVKGEAVKNSERENSIKILTHEYSFDLWVAKASHCPKEVLKIGLNQNTTSTLRDSSKPKAEEAREN